MDFYRLYPEPLPMSQLDGWAGNVGPFTHFFGHSGLGHVFLHSQATGEYGNLDPLVNAFKNYGAGFTDRDDFRAKVLEDPGFRDYILQPTLQQQLEERLGPLDAMDVYFPVPYPFIGGSGAPETYDKGSLLAFASIVAQTLGHTAR